MELVYLIGGCATDIRYGFISGKWSMVFGMLALILRFVNHDNNNIWSIILFDCIPGILMYITAYASREAVGKGDADLIFISGIFLGFWTTVIILWQSLLLVFCIGNIQRRFSLMKKRENTERIEIKYAPFLGGVFLMQIVLHLKKESIYKVRKGSFTLETTLLMPILIAVIMLLIYLGFYLFNRCIVYGDMYIAGLHGSECINDSNEQIWQQVWDEQTASMEQHLLSDSGAQLQVVVDYNKIDLSIESGVVAPLSASENIFSELAAFCYIETVQVDRHRPVTLIRQCRKIEALLTEMDEVE